MTIAVRLFARARELAGTDRIFVTLDEGANVAQFRQQLIEQHPNLRPLATRLLVAVGNEYAAENTVLDESAEVACFPPVSGG